MNKYFIDDSAVPEFKTDLKKLCKKYRHLEDDFERIKKILRCMPENTNLACKIGGLGEEVKISIYKLRKFRSLDFKGKGIQSGFRLIYAFDNINNKVILIEIYHKNKKENEDRKRILKHFKS